MAQPLWKKIGPYAYARDCIPIFYFIFDLLLRAKATHLLVENRELTAKLLTATLFSF